MFYRKLTSTTGGRQVLEIGCKDRHGRRKKLLQVEIGITGGCN